MNEEQLQAQVAQMLQNGASEQEISAFVAEYDSTNVPAQTEEIDSRLIGLVQELQKQGASQQEIDEEILLFDQHVARIEKERAEAAKKEKAATDVTAPAAAETPVDTELQSENGSLDFPGKVVRIKRKDAARGYDEYSYAEIQQKIQDPNFRKGQKRFENVEAYVDAFRGQAQIVDLGAEQVGDLKDSSERETTEAVKFEDGPSVPVSDFEQEVEVVQGFEEVNKLNFEADNNIVENYADIDAYNEIGSKSVGEIDFELPKQELDKSIQDKYTAGFGEDEFIKTFDSQVLKIKQEDIDKKGGEILSKYKFNKETGEFPDKDSERKALEEFEEYQTNLIQNARENSVGYQSRIKAYKNAFVNEIEKQKTKFDEIKAQELSDKTVQDMLPPVVGDVLNFIGIDTAVARTVLEATKSATMGLPAVGGMDKIQSLGVLRDAHQSLRARANNQNTFEGEDTVINGVPISEYTPIRVKNPLYTKWKNSDPDIRDINPPREFSFTLIDTEKQRQAGQYVEGGNKRFKTIHGPGIINYFDTEFEAETFFSKRMGETADDVYKLFDLKSDFDGMLSKIKAAPEFTNEKGEYDSSKFTYENLVDAIGTTATQMLMARLTLGLSSYSQETGNMFEQVLEGKAVEKYGEEFLALSEDKKLEKYLQLTKDGEINYNDIRISGTQIASLDLFGSATALNQVPKIDGSIIRNLFKSNWKGAVKEGKNVAKNILKGGLTEVPTESVQELISGREVNKQLYGMEGAYVTDEQIRSVKEVGFQSLIGVSGTVASGNTAARGIRHLKRKLATGNNRAILDDAKAALEDVELVYESSVNQVNKKLREGSVSKSEADAELSRLKNSRDNQITALYKAQEVATGSKYKNYEPEAREEALNLIVDNLYLNEKVSDIDADAEKAKATGFYSKDDFDGRKQAVEDKMVDNEIERQIIDAKQNYLYAGSQMREFINNNPDKFNNARAVAFETRQEAEEYFKRKFGKDFKPEGRYKQLLDGDVFGFYDPDKNLIIDVKENLFNQGDGNRELQLRNARIASNVVYHEGGHALMSTLEDSELASIKEGLEDFMANSLDPKIVSVYNSVKQREASQKNKKQRVVNEEFIASVSDALREYDIAKGDVATQAGLSKLGTLINGKLSTAAPAGLSFKGLESGTQTLEFIKKYNTFTGTVDPQFSEGRTVTPSGEEKDTTVSEEQVASEIVKEVRFEDDSINEQFKAFTYDGKVNNAPESFHAMAAYQYEPLAQAVVNTLANKGIVSGSAEQNNLIMGYLEDATNRQELVEQLVIPVGGNQASSLLGLAKTYNPEIGSFGGYAKGFLAARAIRQLENKMKASFIGSQKIDSPESKEIEAGEQQIEITQPVVERLKLNDKISEDLNKLGEMATIQAEKAITSKDLSDLKKVNLRNKTFGDIFAKRLFNDVKNVLGKNTKTKSDFTDFLNNNYDALSDIALNYIDFQKGSGPSASWTLDTPPTREEFIEYYEAKDEKTSTRGDRKKSLNNAIARAISNDVRNKMVDDNPSINEGFEKVAGIPLASEALYDLPLQEKKDWFVTLKDAKVDLDGVKLTALTTKEEIDKLIDYHEQHVWPYIPKGLYVFSDAATGNALNKNVGAGIISTAAKMNEPILNEDGTVQMIKRGNKKELVPNKPRYELAKYMAEQTKIRAAAFKNWGDDILLDGKPIEKYRNDHYSKTVQKPLENIAAAYKNGQLPSQSDIDVVVDFNRKNRAIGEEVYKRFNQAIKNDKQNAIGIAAFLQLAGNDTEHFNRQLAEVVGISHTPEGRGKTYEWEHAMQQVHVGKTLLAAMLDNDRNFDGEFAAIMNNFKLIGLDNKHNHMLNKTGYKNSMGKGWDVFKSSWLSRYFNDQVAEIGGIPPNSLVGLDGRTFDEIYNVDVNGNSTKPLASEVIFEPNTPGDFNEASTAYKAIFMVGSPGGGKTNVGKGLRLGRRGYKVVNQDIALEALKKAAGLPENESNYTKEQRSLRSKLGSQAVKAGKDKFQQYKNEGKGFLVDGTGASYNATTKKINELKEAGYDVYLVAAMTPKDVAIERNKARKERSLPTFVVSKSYDQVVESLAKYKQDYGDKVFEIDTTTIGFGEALPQEFLDKVYNGITQTKVAKSTLDKAAESKALASEKLSDEFNEMLERVKGVKAEARYSEARATKLAQNKGRFKFFVPYSAEDYMGLIYPTLGKGKEGDQNLEWYKENILKPFAKGISNFESAKQEAMSNWRNLKKSLKGTPAALGKEAVRGFSNEDAVRVYLWNERGVVPDSLSKKDTEALVGYVNSNKALRAFAEQVVDITEGVDYPAPQKDWMIGTLTTDLVNFVNTAKRSDFLEEWQNNVDIVYSKDNMNKLKAIYGENYVEALENMLYRMKTGRNRPSGQSKIENQFQNWINDSVGTVMFFNTRSAVLQTISAVNFLNWSDNNPIKAGIAFANQPQFWSDFAYLFNSDFLKQRRSGLKNDVNADEIAREAAGATNKYKAALNALLKAGFSPTQIADSFAIAIGGASFYRNRVNTYLKQGMSQKEAEEAAMLDFKETAEESQQSSRPDKVSQEQASSLGRIILAFANTPAQYTRLTKRAAQDLINGRGDWKTNVSKLLYYGAVQNIIFTALQQALFALSFDDEEEEEEIYTKTVNGIVDTLLRGSGVYGAGVATLKNIVMEAIRQAKSKRPDYTKAALKITTLSPPVDTKIRKLMSAGRAFTYSQNLKDMRKLGWDVDNPAALAVGQIASALGNVPLDRAVIKLQNLKDASNSEYETYQRIFLALGWQEWQLGIEEKIKEEKKAKAQKEMEAEMNLTPQERVRLRRERIRQRLKEKKGSPAKRLERGVAGKAHRDGTIEVDPNLSPVEREKTIAHEKQHIKDIKAGKLDYDDNYVYWNGKKYPRKNGKIKYKGNWVEEGHPSLPWEKKAYDAEPSTKEIKEKKKRTKLY